MNQQDFFKYGNAYARYQQGLIDPGDPSAGEPHSTWRFSRNEKWYKGPRDYSSDEQRKMAIDRDTLQLAKTIGPDLTLEEFKKLRDQVEEVHKRYQDQESSAMTNKAKQEAIWSLPNKLSRSNPTHFSPLRFKDGTPVDLDHKDPAGTQAKLKSVPYSQVDHDPRLRDAWQAAQDGHLAALMEAGEGIGGDLTEALGGVNAGAQGSITEPLKQLLQPKDSGEIWSGQPVGWYKGPSEGLQAGVKQESASQFVNAEVVGDIGSGVASMASGGGMLDKIQTGMDAAGVVDPTPIVDGVNAAISLGRAVADPKNAGTHLLNAGISAVSMFPYVGDLAKLAKYGGRGAKAAAGAAKAEGAAAKSGGRFDIGGILGSLFGGGDGATASGDGGSGGGGRNGVFGSFFGGRGGEGGGQGGEVLDGVLDKLVEFGKTFGPTAIVLTATIGGMKMLTNWLKGVDEAARKLIEENRSLAQYDGSLAASYSRLDAGRLQRNIDQAGAISGPMGRLTAAQDQYEATLEDLTLPFKQLGTDIQFFKTTVATGVLKLIDLIEPISEILQWWYGKNKVDGAAKNATEFAAREAERFLKAKKL